jgi:hypothetical protein
MISRHVSISGPICLPFGSKFAGASSAPNGRLAERTAGGDARHRRVVEQVLAVSGGAPPATWRLNRPAIQARDGGNQLLSNLAPCGVDPAFDGMRPPVTPHVPWWPKLQALWAWSALACLVIDCPPLQLCRFFPAGAAAAACPDHPTTRPTRKTPLPRLGRTLHVARRTICCPKYHRNCASNPPVARFRPRPRPLLEHPRIVGQDGGGSCPLS